MPSVCSTSSLFLPIRVLGEYRAWLELHWCPASPPTDRNVRDVATDKIAKPDTVFERNSVTLAAFRVPVVLFPPQCTLEQTIQPLRPPDIL